MAKFKSSLRLLSAPLLIFLGAAVAGWASPSFQPVQPGELQMKSDPQAPGAPAIILYREVDRDDSGRTSHEDNHFRIKIFTEEGRKYADVEIPYEKGKQDVVHIRARTIKPDGSIVNFDGKVFDHLVVKSKSVRYQAKTFTLPDVQPGGIIEYYYTVDIGEDWLFDSHWILSQDMLTKHARFSLKPYEGEGSSPYVLRWSWQDLPTGAMPKQGPDHIVRMEASNVPAFQSEDYMPPENELKARVDFIYTQEFTESDPVKFWRHVGKKRNGELEKFIDKRPAMEQAVSQIVSPADPPEVKLRKIYDRVQQIRNTSYEFGKTEQEEKRAKEKPPENVEELWRRQYGNGQQITWLFLALARAAGFEAHGVWVSDRRNYFFSPKTLQAEKLDANVVLVKVNGEDRYFDPGAEFTPYGLLMWSETGTAGLQLDKNGGTWITTTLPASKQSQTQSVAKLKLSDSGDLEGKLTITYTGLDAMYRRLEERHEDDVARSKFLQDEMKEEIPTAVEATLTNKPDWSGSETPLVAEFDLKVPGWASRAGKRVFFPVGLFSGEEKGMFSHANRVNPIYFPYPFSEVEDVTIELPAGWSVGSVPRPESDDGHVITYTSKAENGGNTLHLTRAFAVDFLLLPQKYYPALQNFFQAVRSADEQQAVVEAGATTASN